MKCCYQLNYNYQKSTKVLEFGSSLILSWTGDFQFYISIHQTYMDCGTARFGLGCVMQMASDVEPVFSGSTEEDTNSRCWPSITITIYLFYLSFLNAADRTSATPAFGRFDILNWETCQKVQKGEKRDLKCLLWSSRRRYAMISQTELCQSINAQTS